jgi:hypothetical protein
MALTLIEAAKMEKGDVIRSAVIELYAGSSDVLRVLPFEDIAGNALKYNREGNLPGVGFRGVNEAYTASTGVLNPMTEPLVIAGGDLDVDNFIIKTMGANIRGRHEAMKIRALALAFTRKFIKGDQSSDPREFDGLQRKYLLAGGGRLMAVRNQQAGRGSAPAAGACTEEARRRRPRHEVEAIHDGPLVLARRRADGILISFSIF